MTPDFKKFTDGLIPVVIQDEKNSQVLMLGYMNAEAFEITQKEKRVTFFSRSKKRLWTKGEESGNFLEVVEIFLDCDQDAVLIKCRPVGPVCHTGSDSCFNTETPESNFLNELETIIQERKLKFSEGSYVSALFKKGINTIAQKFGEESVELLIETKDDNDELFRNEAADLLFHYLILLAAKGYALNDISEVLRLRNAKRTVLPKT